VGIQAVQNHADNETQTVQNLTNNETQTDPFERTCRPPYRLPLALEFIRAASASYPGHNALQLAYRWLNLSTTLDWYAGIVSKRRKLAA